MLTVAFGESTMSRTQVQWWCNRFNEGREDGNFHGCFRHTMCFSENCSKIAIFWAKSRSHGHRSGKSDLLVTNHGCMAMTLKPKPNHPNGKPFATIGEIKESWVYGYDIETKAQSSQWKAFCYDWVDKRTIETGNVGDTKKRISEVFWGLE